MYCTFCGARAVASDRFCNSCGRPIRRSTMRYDLAPRTSAQAPRAIRPASQTLRFLNFLLDYAFFLVFLLVVVYIVAGLLSVAGSYDVDSWNRFFGGLGGYLFVAIFYVVYYWLQEGIFGRTLGKLVTGTMVVKGDGSKASSAEALKRSLARAVPFEAFSFFGSKTPRGWHDAWTQTLVVRGRRQAQH